MPAKMFRWTIVAALPLASLAMPATLGAPAIAEEAAPPAVTPDDTIWQFGRHEKLCIEWTDDCRQCRRAETDAISCSEYRHRLPAERNPVHIAQNREVTNASWAVRR